MPATISLPATLALQLKQTQDQSVNVFEDVDIVFIDLESIVKASQTQSYQDYDVKDFYSNVDYCKDTSKDFLFLKNSDLLHEIAVKRIQMNLMTNGYTVQPEPYFFNGQECLLYSTS